MTTDLTGDFELGEDEFDWDVFLPDPDEAEIAAEAAALEDEAELDLDDSDFDWEAALREDGEPESGADDGARAGAAYDRIVDTVRRSFEEPRPRRRTSTGSPRRRPVALQEPETLVPLEPEDEVEAERVSALVPDDEPVPEDELAPEGRARGARGVRDLRRARARGRPCVGIGLRRSCAEPDPEPQPRPGAGRRSRSGTSSRRS